MLCSCFTNDAFAEIPSDTNVVKSHNRISKGTPPDVLKVALMTMYKVDMAAALEHLAQSRDISTSYESLTPEARSSRITAANKARSRKRARGEDGDGPPDKKSHFQAGKPLLENEFEVDTCTAVMLLYEHWEWYVTIVYTKI